ncbi:hypothetical protein GGR55DRAFT_331695 [Xylaria sp. FL0064]|nr:hypothetical protein GGR55DRAFT_331695 [Xylaria sp. FL0064]
MTKKRKTDRQTEIITMKHVVDPEPDRQVDRCIDRAHSVSQSIVITPQHATLKQSKSTNITTTVTMEDPFLNSKQKAHLRAQAQAAHQRTYFEPSPDHSSAHEHSYGYFRRKLPSVLAITVAVVLACSVSVARGLWFFFTFIVVSNLFRRGRRKWMGGKGGRGGWGVALNRYDSMGSRSAAIMSWYV